jgi:hypothetical protein
VQPLVDGATVLGDTLPQATFQDAPAFLQDPGRGRIPLVDCGFQPGQVEIGEGIFG